MTPPRLTGAPGGALVMTFRVAPGIGSVSGLRGIILSQVYRRVFAAVRKAQP